jgi:hypothetical protein
VLAVYEVNDGDEDGGAVEAESEAFDPGLGARGLKDGELDHGQQ